MSQPYWLNNIRINQSGEIRIRTDEARRVEGALVGAVAHVEAIEWIESVPHHLVNLEWIKFSQDAKKEELPSGRQIEPRKAAKWRELSVRVSCS